MAILLFNYSAIWSQIKCRFHMVQNYSHFAHFSRRNDRHQNSNKFDEIDEKNKKKAPQIPAFQINHFFFTVTYKTIIIIDRIKKDWQSYLQPTRLFTNYLIFLICTSHIILILILSFFTYIYEITPKYVSVTDLPYIYVYIYIYICFSPFFFFT